MYNVTRTKKIDSPQVKKHNKKVNTICNKLCSTACENDAISCDPATIHKWLEDVDLTDIKKSKYFNTRNKRGKLRSPNAVRVRDAMSASDVEDSKDDALNELLMQQDKAFCTFQSHNKHFY